MLRFRRDVGSGTVKALSAWRAAQRIERTLLEQLRRAGPASRPDLARIAGLSKPTVSQALANLESAGLVGSTRVEWVSAPS